MGIDRDRAAQIALAEAARRGAKMREPVRVTRGLRRFTVQDRMPTTRGGQIRVTIDRRTGEVVRFWIAPK